ncbi:EC1118_1H13_0320p [Saccharomyces cerevisiae EC1118]|uniref:Uncharacterized protein YHR073W-A n=2 Tax=Saccharomyces cerevisiae TaxID=4932 RepID=YH73A_YEAST|nr:RecName: Full=Uncharacterized protein YHR073W-A [Saccharomyces cerevisiae S288C]WNM97000.1 hypothetical protein RMP76_141 [Saccharomyces cerevisiae synthetic construct]CAY80081.1 EC1118_1H13_0320p [Saccharomyces cerevisiae EC1118]
MDRIIRGKRDHILHCPLAAYSSNPRKYPYVKNSLRQDSLWSRGSATFPVTLWSKVILK